MADGMWKVRMKAAFTAYNENFRPDADYWVSDAIYNSPTDIEPYGAPFKELCLTASQEAPR